MLWPKTRGYFKIIKLSINFLSREFKIDPETNWDLRSRCRKGRYYPSTTSVKK